MNTYEEKPAPKQTEKQRGKQILVLLSASLGLTMLVGGSLYLLAHRVPFGFTLPFLNINNLADTILFVIVVSAAAYIGMVGLKELFVERRFSVEFLMAVAALSAVYLGYFLEAASVLFLYSLAEYFEDYLEDRARRTVEKLSSFMPDKAHATEMI